jgi:alkylation response protein AidB-like acyl-CoA dehydrogenase
MDAGRATRMSAFIRLPIRSIERSLLDWLDAHATALDEGQAEPTDVLPRLADAGLFKLGVPIAHGGVGGTSLDAVAAIATIAEHSLTAAFVFWGHRTFIEYLLESPNASLRERWLAPLLAGKHAGATGLSNAMKYLGGIEPLQMRAHRAPDGWILEGQLPWVTNLRKEGFIVAAAVDHADRSSPSIFAIPHDAQGVARSADLDLIALRSSNTAAISVEETWLSSDWEIDPDALSFLSRVRPAFLAMQCALSIGLARRSLSESLLAAETLGAEIDALDHRLQKAVHLLSEGLSSGLFRSRPAPLFEIRIELAAIACAAVNLEIQTSGGRGYLRDAGGASRRGDVARRWREAAFIPVVTPSLTQLKSQLAKHAGSNAA